MIIKFFLFALYGLLICAGIMTMVWWRQLYTKNAGIVDGWWAFNFGILMICFALLSSNWDRYVLVFGACVICWSLRLGYHLLRRNMSHAEEDTRYQRLREEYGKQVHFKMWRFFMYQAASNMLLAFPFIIICILPRKQVVWLVLGLAIWFIAFIGETIADAQLKAFKRHNPGSVCQSGLWNYSRHPNYFFEWLIWISFFVMSLSVEWGWVSAICPLIIYFLLNKVTGIPMLEELAVASKGRAYIEYQQQTSAFFPWFKKHIT